MGSIDIWDVGTGVVRQTIPSGLGVIRTAALAPDGKTVAIGAAAPEIGQWDVETGQKKLAEFVGHGREIHSVAYSPDGEAIATLAENGDLRLWDGVTGKQRRQMKSSYRAHLAFDSTGKQLTACGRWSGEVNVWNVRTGEQTFVLKPGEKSVRRAGFTADGKYVVAVGSNPRDGSSARDLITDRFHIWDAMTGRHIREFEFTAGITESMLLLPKSRSVVLGAVYGAESKGMRVFDLETGAETGVAIGNEATVYSLAYGDGLVASGSQDKTVRLWDATTWKQIAVLTGHEEHVISVAFSPDGKWLVSGDLAGSVRVWNVETRKQIYELPNQGCGVLSLCLSPTGHRIVTAMQNATALVWAAPFAQP
jgi:WD40 repeat protein